MGYTKTTFNVPFQKLEQSGVGGYWWVEKDSLGDASKIGYNDLASVESAGTLFGASNFKNLLDKLVTEGIAIKDFPNPINCDDILVENGIENQVTNLDTAELAQIDTDWNTNVLVKRWNNPLLAIAFFKEATYTWVGLKTRFTEMGETGKLLRDRLVFLLNGLVTDGNITQGQMDSFLVDWDNNPNIN